MEALQEIVGADFPNPMKALWGDELVPHALTRDLPLMNLRTALAISVGYLAVTWGLVRFMENRKPYDLYGLRLFHNVFLVAVSGAICAGIVYEALKGQYSLFCNTLNEDAEADRNMSRLIYVFYVSKVYEFMDTFIMALRKKTSQISFLHVYHHASIFLIWWLNVLYFPSGDAYFAPAFNAFIHVLMYSYYTLSTFQIPCPWKSWITKFQLLQFVSFLVQGGMQLLVPGCFPHTALTTLNTAYAFSLFFLFADFYIRTYVFKAPARSAPAPAKKPAAAKKSQ